MILAHSEKTLELLRKETDEIIIMYSGGKDSVTCCDLVSKLKFKRVVCAFMYVVKGMDHMAPALQWPKDKYGFEVIQVPHWKAIAYYRNGHMRLVSNPNIKMVRQGDVENAVRAKTGIKWIVKGYKVSDSMVRRYILNRAHMNSIAYDHHLCFPLSRWKKNDVISYIKQHKLFDKSQTYGAQFRASGFNVDKKTITWLHDHWPNDYKKVLLEYPLAEQLIKVNNEKPKPPRKVRNRKNESVPNQGSAIQPAEDLRQGEVEVES